MPTYVRMLCLQAGGAPQPHRVHVHVQAVLLQRQRFARWLSANASKYWLVYYDEQPWGVSAARSRGRAPKGRAAVKEAPQGESGYPNTATLVGAVSPQFGAVAAEYYLTETVTAQHTIHMLGKVKKAMDAITAERRRVPGAEVREYIVVMDNARIHTAKVVREYLQQSGLKVQFTARYSPMFNAIESVFSNTAISVRCNWRHKPTAVLDGDGKWQSAPASWTLGRAVKQAFVNAATPDKVRQYELGMFKFMPAAEALMVLECTGDPPSEEQLQEWVRTTTAAKVDAEIRSRIASQSQSSGEPPESVVASLGLGDAAV